MLCVCVLCRAYGWNALVAATAAACCIGCVSVESQLSQRVHVASLQCYSLKKIIFVPFVVRNWNINIILLFSISFAFEHICVLGVCLQTEKHFSIYGCTELRFITISITGIFEIEKWRYLHLLKYCFHFFQPATNCSSLPLLDQSNDHLSVEWIRTNSQQTEKKKNKKSTKTKCKLLGTSASIRGHVCSSTIESQMTIFCERRKKKK